MYNLHINDKRKAHLRLRTETDYVSSLETRTRLFFFFITQDGRVPQATLRPTSVKIQKRDLKDDNHVFMFVAFTLLENHALENFILKII